VADWATISSLATASGTLVLAVATFASVRSANRSARVAEFALQEQRRPVLVNSREDDRPQTVGFMDDHWVHIPGGAAVVEAVDGAVYLAMSLRNVGVGIAVLQAWHAAGGRQAATTPMPDLDAFRPLGRDQYVAGGDVGVWQAAIRDPADSLYAALTAATAPRTTFSVYLLYTDQVGGQRTVSRFGVLPDSGDGWVAAAARHWYLDAPAPR
jgi:hypothetical protein